MKTESLQSLLTHQHVLLLQGKMGSFFHRFASFLHTHHIQVSKINFNAGDEFFYRHDRVFNYTGTQEDFCAWLHNFIRTQNIDVVVCFGDCRPHHMIASQVCKQQDLAFFVFEEGYLRPDYITFEKEGINGFSALQIDKVHELSKATDTPIKTYNSFYRLSAASITYYMLSDLKKSKYPHYQHYRGMTAIEEAKSWLKAPFRKMRYYISDKIKLKEHLVNHLDHQYFVVCLQVHNDSQITHHSHYNDVRDFIKEVMFSFSQHAKPQHALVLKHHPLDCGHRDYRQEVMGLATEYGIAGRVFYGVDMHLPTIIKHSLGMVVVNSTTGLQSIYHKKPTKAMGEAIYNVDKLTDQQPLDKFWQNPQKPNHDFYLRFREYLIEQNQLNGSFFGSSPWMDKYPPIDNKKLNPVQQAANTYLSSDVSSKSLPDKCLAESLPTDIPTPLSQIPVNEIASKPSKTDVSSH